MRITSLLVLPSVLALTACGPHAKLDVSMRSVSITVPRILTPAMDMVAPPLQPIAVPLPLLPLPPLPPLPATPTVHAPPTSAPPPRPAPCPSADPLAVPDEPASVTVKNPPTPGTYVQNSNVTYTGSTATPAAGSLKGTVTTTITSLPTATSTVGQKLQAWQVTRIDSTTKQVSIEVYQLVRPSTSPLATAPGIYLTGLRWNDPARGAITFQPSGGGVEILPLPVAPSATLPYQYESSQTDPDTLTTLTLGGNVVGRKRVDVCGTLIDTFTIELSGTLTSPGQQRQVAWRQQLATQSGAAEIEDELMLTDATGAATWKRTLRNTTVPKDTP